MRGRVIGTLIFMFAMCMQETASGSEVVIGQVAPLAAADSAGSQLGLGARVYFAAVNARGGVYGNMLRFVARDRGFRNEDAVMRTRELIETSQPIALVGLLGTGPMEELVRSKLLDQHNLPVVGIRTGAVSLHEPAHPYLYHTRASYGGEVEKILTQLTTTGLNRIAVLHENSAFGREGVSLVERALQKQPQMKLVTLAGYEAGASDFAAAVRQISQAQPQGIIAISNSAAAGTFYKELRKHGDRTQVLALSVVDASEVVRKIGMAAAKGLIVTQVVPDPGNTAMPLIKELHADFRKHGPPGATLTQTVVEGYLAAKTLVEGLRIAGPGPTRKKLRTALDSMRYFDAGGVILDFSPDNHTGSKYVELAILLGSGKLMR